MFARIYKIGKSPGQSGPNRAHGSNKWTMEFVHEDKFIDNTMGWASSPDTMHEVKMSFDSQEEAVRFAEKNHYNFEIVASVESKLIKKSYADNFV